MSNKDHTVLITVCALVGIVVTVTVAILGSIYNNGKNIERDKFMFSHCSKVNQESRNDFTTVIKYKCEGSK